MTTPVPGLTIEQQPEGIVLRMLAWGEARGEGIDGMVAVLHVVRNRALKRDTTMKHEALRRLQFSCFNDNDPNRGKMLAAWHNDPAGWGAAEAAVLILNEKPEQDPTHGATHYYVTAMPHPPAWSKPEAGWETTAVLGHHTFGRAT